MATASRSPASQVPRLATWIEANIPKDLIVLAFPTRHQRRLRTSNGLERLTQEIRRRSRIAVLCPKEASRLRLVTSVVMEISEEWQVGRVDLRVDAILGVATEERQ